MKLENLVTFCTNMWPNPMSTYKTPPSISGVRWYEHQLQRLAQHVFSWSDRDGNGKLKIIAFGPNGTTSFTDSNEDPELDQMYFMRGKMTDPFGKTFMLATKVPLWEVRYEVTEVEVLTSDDIESGIDMYS